MVQTQQVKIDGHSFVVDVCAAQSEKDFIANHIDSVKPSLGSDENKTAFLKAAYAKIKEAKQPVASAATEK